MSGFAGDRGSGSSAVAAGFLAALTQWLANDRSPSAAELRVTLLAWLREAQAAQPSMALVHQLAARALAVADTGARRGDSPLDVRRALEESGATERADLEAATATAARIAAELLPGPDPWIATLSASAGVAAALSELHRLGRRPRVLVAESRPRLEGRAMAATLAAQGIPVWLVADSALPMLFPQAAAVWIGADAVTELGVLNKIGSYAAALAAREHGVPVWSIAVRRKILPAATPALSIAEMPPEEIWDTPAPGVRPRNVYFEMVPIALLRGVVVEDGVLGPAELGIAARDRELPSELASEPARG